MGFPISRSIAFFFKTYSSSIEVSSKNTATRQDQKDLYRSRLALHNYIIAHSSYSTADKTFFGAHRTSHFSNKLVQYSLWQRELHFRLFDGSRSRVNNVYSQQHVGNLQIIRRIFAVSWSSHEILIPPYWKTKEKIFLRRKVALDQGNFDDQDNISEHREIGKTTALKIRNGIERKHIIDLLSSRNVATEIPSSRKFGSWVLISKKRISQDRR